MRLLARANAQLPGLWLQVPRTLGERRFRSVSVSSRYEPSSAEVPHEPETRVVNRFDREYILIPLGEGAQDIEVGYQ